MKAYEGKNLYTLSALDWQPMQLIGGILMYHEMTPLIQLKKVKKLGMIFEDIQWEYLNPSPNILLVMASSLYGSD